MIKTKRIQDILLEIRFEVNILSLGRESILFVLVESEIDVYRTSVVKNRSNTIICLMKREAFTGLCCCQFSLGCLSMFVNPEQLPIILYGYAYLTLTFCPLN